MDANPTMLKAETQPTVRESACRTAGALKRAFCPHNGQVGAATAELEKETGALLRSRLRAVCLLLMVADSLFLLRNQFLTEDPFSRWCLAQLAVLGACAGVLFFAKRSFSLTQLRAIELVIFGSMAVYLGIIHYKITELALVNDTKHIATSSPLRHAVSYFALIAAYGMFIPNTWRRAALAVLPLGVAPLVLTYWHMGRNSVYRDLIEPTLNLEEVSGIALIMLIAVMIAVLGAHVIHSIRREVAEAKDLGLYKLEEKIGEGGMGEVWRAQHSLLTRPAAIKMIKANVLDSDPQRRQVAVERFQREARATAGLRSPHTIELYDFGVTDDDTLYYVMEYLDGLTLDALVRRFGPLPAERAIYLLRQSVSSLDEAHRAGLIHRDIKPANLHVSTMGVEHDFVKVLDFGLVKLSHDNDPAAVNLTREDTTTGTPAFMPPEMALGKPVDQRTDIYALGCVAYWLLTGQRVFTSSTPMEMIVDHVKTAPVSPSERTDNPLPPALERLVMSCLEKDPENRPQAMTDLGLMLDACASRTPWTQARAATWWSSNMPAPLARRVA